MKNLLAHDIMVPLDEYPCIAHTLTLHDAIQEMAVQILRRKQLSLPRVALVFDDDYEELLGMLRRRDIMRGLEPSFLVSGPLGHQQKRFQLETDPNLAELSFEKIISHIRMRANRQVGELMIPIESTINGDDHITKVMYEMVNRNTSLLPVLEENKIVGVVRSVDVLSEIALFLAG